MTTPAQPPVIDPSKPAVIVVVGKKGSGKSVAARALWTTWPYDAICIDPTGDAEPPGATAISLPLPNRFPDRGEDGLPLRLHFVPDPGSDTYLDDLDRALGLALYPKDRPILVWVDEGGELDDSAKKAAVMQRRLLNQSRHYKVTAMVCCPRPMKELDPLWLSQADYVFVYWLPNPADRQRVAEMIGYPPARFHDECLETHRRGAHWFLLYDARAGKLWRMPPMPEVA